MPDTFRKTYKELSSITKDDIFIIKEKAEALLNYLESIEINSSTDKRCMSLAKTNLEQAVMWAIKSIT